MDAQRATALLADERELAEYERAYAQWKRSKSGDPPARPKPPTAVRYVVSDTTIEQLVAIMDSLRGLDELYGKGMETLLQNSAVQVFFASNDDVTTHYVSKRLVRPEVKGWVPNVLDHHNYKYVYLLQCLMN